MLKNGVFKSWRLCGKNGFFRSSINSFNQKMSNLYPLEKIPDDHWPEHAIIAYQAALKSENPLHAILDLLIQYGLPIPVNYGYEANEYMRILCSTLGQPWASKKQLLDNQESNKKIMEMLEAGTPGPEVYAYAQEHHGDWEGAWTLFQELKQAKEYLKKEKENFAQAMKRIPITNILLAEQVNKNYKAKIEAAEGKLLYAQRKITEFKDTTPYLYK
jgi:hypothetical protein